MKPASPLNLSTVIGAALLLAAAQATAQPAPGAPAGQAAQSTETAVSPAVQKVSVKGTARFDPAKAEINSEDGTRLMTEVRSVKNVSWQTIRVTGHTDSLGPEDYNQSLSERRAEAVQAFLIDKGVKPERIRIDARGETTPVASNKTASGRSQNRRVEIEFQGVQSLAQQ